MSEAIQDLSCEENDEASTQKRRKEKMLAAKRTPSLLAKLETSEQELQHLICDSLALSSKQRLLSGFIGLAFFVPYLCISLTHPEWAGHIGRRLSQGLFLFLGQTALFIPPALVYLLLSAAGLRALRKTRYILTPFIVIALSALIERSSQSGGWLGRAIDRVLVTAVGPGGAWLFTSTAAVLLTIGFFPGSWKRLLNFSVQKLTHTHKAISDWLANLEQSRLKKQPETASKSAFKDSPEARSTQPLLAASGEVISFESTATYQAHKLPIGESMPAIAPLVGGRSNSEAYPFLSVDELNSAELEETQELEPDKDIEFAPKPINSPVNGTTADLSAAYTFDSEQSSSHTTRPLDQPDDPTLAVPKARAFELPPLALLDDTPFSERRPRLEDKSKPLLDALDSFGVKAKLSQIVRGPSVTRYELLPARGVKVSKFTSLTNDIALALASTAVRIEAPIPGKSAIGIEIPNEITDLVVLKDIIRDTTFTNSKGLTVALGKDLTGRPMVTDLQKMPHLLVAGTTGSGKSVCVNGLIVSLLYRFTPNELQLMMVDPKQVELSIYEEIPHLVGFTEGGAGEIIVDPKKAAQALHQVVELMEQRYTQFAQAKVRNLAEYNQKAESPLPWFVVIIDELADLMMVASKSVETSICRIAQKARAAGIHLVLATQRPSADVITGLIKVNIPSRIAFAVSSQVDSRVILDSGGAENLLGKGDMLFLPVDASDPRRIQGAYVTNEEISRIVEFWKGQALPENRIEFELKDELLLDDAETGEDNSDDALLEEALRVVLQRDQASASMLQTDLKVGYARARRLLMAMEKKGWVSPAEGSKPRKILFSGSLPTSEG